MGQLIDGTWHDNEAGFAASDGAFKRKDSVFRNWITADGSPGPSGEGGFKAESGRYHLYVSYACPWAHRTLIFRELKDLTTHIDVDVVHPDMMANGWPLSADFPGATGDRLFGKDFVYQIYQEADPEVTTRATVPILWDKAQGKIVSNESAEIIRMFNSAFNGITGNTADYWPEAMRDEIEDDRILPPAFAALDPGVAQFNSPCYVPARAK